ncbi:MAG TPA: UbiX family flavin prenyltransferase [Phycisphaerales bacterium]|nr:UbiX family flavin prenyltransferase [Phycisphaerales bacterium]
MSERSRRRYIVGITGASGALYARRVISCILTAGHECHLTVTPLGQRLLADELGLEAVTAKSAPLLALAGLPHNTDRRERGLFFYSSKDVGAAIGSGSFRHDGMVIVPCSSRTLCSIAAGTGDTLVARAAMCALKERMKLVLAHRETPLSLIDIRAMETVTLGGAIVCPANPGFYLLPRSVDEIVDFVAGRLLDLLGCEHDLKVRWEERVEADRSGETRTGPAC